MKLNATLTLFASLKPITLKKITIFSTLLTYLGTKNTMVSLVQLEKVDLDSLSQTK